MVPVGRTELPLPPLLKPDGSLAHTAEEKSNLFANLFTENSRLDTSGETPPSVPRCDTIMAEIRINQQKLLIALRDLDVNTSNSLKKMRTRPVSSHETSIPPLYRHRYISNMLEACERTTGS